MLRERLMEEASFSRSPSDSATFCLSLPENQAALSTDALPYISLEDRRHLTLLMGSRIKMISINTSIPHQNTIR